MRKKVITSNLMGSRRPNYTKVILFSFPTQNQVCRQTDGRNVVGYIYHVLNKPENEDLYPIAGEPRIMCQVDLFLTEEYIRSADLLIYVKLQGVLGGKLQSLYLKLLNRRESSSI